MRAYSIQYTTGSYTVTVFYTTIEPLSVRTGPRALHGPTATRCARVSLSGPLTGAAHARHTLVQYVLTAPSTVCVDCVTANCPVPPTSTITRHPRPHHASINLSFSVDCSPISSPSELRHAHTTKWFHFSINYLCQILVHSHIFYNSKDGEQIMPSEAAEGWMTGELGRILAQAVHRSAPC